MKKIIYLFMGVILMATACKSEVNNAETLEESFDERVELGQLDSIRAELQKAMPNVPIDLYKKAIAMHLQFVEYNPEDDFAPVALDYAQGFSEQIQDLRSSISIINRILKEYPDFKGKQMLMYIKATHHDFLRDTTEARMAYEDYLKEFPKLSKEERAEVEELIILVPLSMEERIKLNSSN